MPRTACRIISFLLVPGLSACAASETAAPLELAVSIDESLSGEPRDGRIILVLATDEGREPRFQVNAGLNAAQIFDISPRLAASMLGCPGLRTVCVELVLTSLPRAGCICLTIGYSTRSQ